MILDQEVTPDLFNFDPDFTVDGEAIIGWDLFSDDRPSRLGYDVEFEPWK